MLVFILRSYYEKVVLSLFDGISVEKIPQVNAAQCQVNAKNYNNVKYEGSSGGRVFYKTHCIVGSK